MRRLFTLFVFLMMLSASCAPSERTAEREPDQPLYEAGEESEDEFSEEELDEFDLLLYYNRSRLSDQFASLEHDMPEPFLEKVASDEQNTDNYAGYRVQILSTRDVSHADSTRDDFRVWAQENIGGYQPESYVLFRQPYYRVRAGDFRDREKAIEFSRLVKNRFPEAWVVHDRIDPDKVPSDTTRFELLDPVRIDPSAASPLQEQDK